MDASNSGKVSEGKDATPPRVPPPVPTTTSAPSAFTARELPDPVPRNQKGSPSNSTGLGELPVANDKYDELREIGFGAYGTVYRGRDHKTDQYVALKKLRIDMDESGVPPTAVREITILKKLGKFEHPNIVRLLDICHGNWESLNRLNLVFVFEYIEQDLDKYIKNCPSPGLSVDDIKSIMHQILNGVDFIHSHRVVHRDLKPQNILVSRNNRVKIADFGLARIYDYRTMLTTKVVTLYYRAPEVLLSYQYATPVDLWSCGCIFAELYRRKPLFRGTTEGDQLQQIFDVIGRPRESEWPQVSVSLSNFRDHRGTNLIDLVPEITPDAVDMLRKLLQFDPKRRLSAQEALKHYYFRGLGTPRVSTVINRPSTTSTQPVLSPITQPNNYLPSSPPQIHQHYTPPATISTTSTSVVTTTTEISTDIKMMQDDINEDKITNDENNPNAGNSVNTTPTSVPETGPTKHSERDTSSSAIDTSETSINDSSMSVSSNDIEGN